MSSWNEQALLFSYRRKSFNKYLDLNKSSSLLNVKVSEELFGCRFYVSGSHQRCRMKIRSWWNKREEAIMYWVANNELLYLRTRNREKSNIEGRTGSWVVAAAKYCGNGQSRTRSTLCLEFTLTAESEKQSNRNQCRTQVLLSHTCELGAPLWWHLTIHIAVCQTRYFINVFGENCLCYTGFARDTTYCICDTVVCFYSADGLKSTSKTK